MRGVAPSQLHIRDEAQSDRTEIRRVHQLAFERDDEANLVDGLRRSGDAVLSLVAEQDSQVVGHIQFSRLKSPASALSLAPVAVVPGFQSQGIGSKLIRTGLGRAREDGWAAVFVLGNPAYYARFGFSVAEARGFDSEYSGDHFMVAVLDRGAPRSGRVEYPEPFALFG